MVHLHHLCLQFWFVLLVTVSDIHKLSPPPHFPVLLLYILFHSPHIHLLCKCIPLTLDHLHRSVFHIPSFQDCTLHLLCKCIPLTLDHLHRSVFHILSFQDYTLHLLPDNNKPELPILLCWTSFHTPWLHHHMCYLGICKFLAPPLHWQSKFTLHQNTLLILFLGTCIFPIPSPLSFLSNRYVLILHM